MTTMRRDRLVDDYLRRLEAAAAHLPRDRRAELVGEIEEHVDAALAEGGDDEAAVRNVLERLGSPEEIAAAAAPPAAQRGRGSLENAALIVLCLSCLVPLLGYLIGTALVLASQAWHGREKLIGLVVAPIVVFAGASAVFLGVAHLLGEGEDSGGDAFVVTTSDPVRLPLFLFAFVAGFAAAAYLSSRLRGPRAG